MTFLLCNSHEGKHQPNVPLRQQSAVGPTILSSKGFHMSDINPERFWGWKRRQVWANPRHLVALLTVTGVLIYPLILLQCRSLTCVMGNKVSHSSRDVSWCHTYPPNCKLQLSSRTLTPYVGGVADKGDTSTRVRARCRMNCRVSTPFESYWVCDFNHCKYGSPVPFPTCAAVLAPCQWNAAGCWNQRSCI